MVKPLYDGLTIQSLPLGRRIWLTGNLYTGLHEFVDMAFLLHLANEDDLFLDVGANRGHIQFWQVVFVRQDYRIRANSDTFQKLCLNVSINGLDDKVRCENIGSVRKLVPFAFRIGLMP